MSIAFNYSRISRNSNRFPRHRRYTYYNFFIHTQYRCNIYTNDIINYYSYYNGTMYKYI